VQLEYYLGDENLQRDAFFNGKLSSSAGGWLDIDLVMSCKRVQALGASRDDVVQALRDSTLAEVRADALAIRRRDNRPLPPLCASKGKGQAARTKGAGRGRGVAAGTVGGGGGSSGRGACSTGLRPPGRFVASA